MKPITFVESEMTFDAEKGYRIELGTLYMPIQEGVKIAEMLLLRPDGRLWMIEAKSSSPRPENNPDFQTFLDEITSKFVNTLNLYFAARLGRHDAQRLDWPPAFAHVDASTAVLQLILVINGHKAKWLSPINDGLAQTLVPLVKTWALGAQPLVVLNDEMARKHRLIV